VTSAISAVPNPHRPDPTCESLLTGAVIVARHVGAVFHGNASTICRASHSAKALIEAGLKQ